MPNGFEIILGDTVHCKELVSGHQLAGRFSYSRDKGLLTTLFSFDEYIHIEPEAPIYLLTEQLEVLSLFDSFGGPGRRWNGEPPKILHTHSINSNTVIAGEDMWAVEDRVKRVGFSVPEAFSILKNRQKLERLNLSKPERKDDDWLVLDLKARNKSIRLFYLASYEAMGNEPREVIPRFEIEFNDPVELSDYVSSMQEVLTFLSFALGVRVSPENISISRISLREYLDYAEQGKHLKDHRVLSLWSQDEIKSDDFHLSGVPVFALDINDLDALGQSLLAWVERAENWLDVYLLMVVCFSKRNEISGARLLAASKWLEKIPTAKPEKTLSDEDMNKVVDAAFSAAGSLQEGIERQRIAGSLRMVSYESRSQHMQRLVSLAWERRQLPRPLEEFVKHLKLAQLFRGKAAHGHLELSEEQPFRECARAIAALEALCLILMAVDLPLSEDGKDRLFGHRVVTEYRYVL